VAATLRERGQFDPGNPGYRSLDEREPLTAAEHLEHMAIGEALARYYRHPSMLDRAVRAGASWDEVGAARGTSAKQARRDYRAWADGQHHLHAWSGGRFGMSDAEYAEAKHRAGPTPAEPHSQPGAAAEACSRTATIPACRANPCLIRTPSTDYAKAVGPGRRE
jgi:hypothetical protein